MFAKPRGVLKSKDNKIELLKEFKDENYFSIESLPNEIMVEIFSYLDENGKVKVSLVNKRWLQVANNEIENLSIKWPLQQNQDVQNLMNRFSKLKNIELATMVTDAWMIYGKDSGFLPVHFFEFTGSLEFDIDPDLIPTKSKHSTSITRIRINPAKEIGDFGYNEDQIINFEIDMRTLVMVINGQMTNWIRLPTDVDTVVEEILSLNNVSKIKYSQNIHRAIDYQQEKLKFIKIVESILSRPYLKQIEFDITFDFNLDIENEFSKNFHVEEIKLRSTNFSLKLWKNIYDALPNIRKVKVVMCEDIKNLVVILKGLCNFKNLKFLHVTIRNRDRYKIFNEPKIRDCFDVIRDNFPMKTKVFIADMDSTNLIEREEGNEPKIVNGQSRFSRYFS